MVDQILSVLLTLVSLTPFVGYLVAVVAFLVSASYSRLKFYKPSDPLKTVDKLPGVSILKPLMGADALLEKNIESHFLLDYPEFELLFCVQDPKDAAIDVVKKLQQRYPLVQSKLFIGGRNGILNPMIHNAAPAYDHCQYDIVWMSTSRIYATTEILTDMVAKLQNPKVALVHQMPFTTDQPGFPAVVEKIYFGCNIPRGYLTAHVLGISCIVGMSYLVKKPELDSLNGLSWFGRFLSEDFFIAKLLHDRGFYHQVAAIPAQQNVANPSISGYYERMVRWTRLRLNMIPVITLTIEWISESIPLGLLASWSFHFLFGFNPYLWFTCHWIIWCCLDYIQLVGIQHTTVPFSVLTYVEAWIVREVLFVVSFIEALLNPKTVFWGKNVYRMSDFGRSLQIVSNASSSVAKNGRKINR